MRDGSRQQVCRKIAESSPVTVLPVGDDNPPSQGIGMKSVAIFLLAILATLSLGTAPVLAKQIVAGSNHATQTNKINDLALIVLAWLLTLGAGTGMIYALLECLQRRKAIVRNGWRYLMPGPTVWTALILGFGFTLLLSYIFLFVGSARYDAAHQMTVLLYMTTTLNLGTILTAYLTIVEQVRWNAERIERRTLLLKNVP